MMTDEIYSKYLGKIIKESLFTQFDCLNNKYGDNEMSCKYAINTIIYNPDIINSMVVSIKEWSYNQAIVHGLSRTPHDAMYFLSLKNINDYTAQYISYIANNYINVQAKSK